MRKHYIQLIFCICFFLSGCHLTNNVATDDTKINTIESNNDTIFESGDSDTETKEITTSFSDEENKSSIVSEQDLQQQIYDRYYASWSDEALLTAINDKQTYLDNCTFYQEVKDYMEQIREVRDVSNMIEPLYSTDMKYYQKQDFDNAPSIIIRLAKNEIYARKGYIFQDKDLLNYFMGQLWYEPLILPDDFDDCVFNEYEKANLALLVELE